MNTQTLWLIVEQLLAAFARHQNGEDVSRDLDELQNKVRALKQHEQDIIDG